MEKIILGLVVVAAVAYLIYKFKNPSKGCSSGGCCCGSSGDKDKTDDKKDCDHC